MGNKENIKRKLYHSRRRSNVRRARNLVKTSKNLADEKCAAQQVELTDRSEPGKVPFLSSPEYRSESSQIHLFPEPCFSEIAALEQCSDSDISEVRRKLHDSVIGKDEDSTGVSEARPHIGIFSAITIVSSDRQKDSIDLRKLHDFGGSNRAESPVDSYDTQRVHSHVELTGSTDPIVHEGNPEKVGSDPVTKSAPRKFSDVDEPELLVDSESPLHVGHKSVEVKGRRIVDITFFLQQLHEKFDAHSHGLECHFRHLKLERYVDRGLRTQLQFRCEMCNYSFDIWTDPDYRNIMGINESAICGTITSGTGCSTLQEQLAAMDVPSLSHVTYRKYRQKIFNDFKSVATEEMAVAAEEEKKIAIEKGNLANSIPFITVVADGCWSKRSYTGGKHDALSGAAMIIGFETKKVLFVAVRNKYCAVDAMAERLNKEPPEHACYKNWGRNQRSTAMEADIIVEGFKNSVEMNGLIYKTLISDGDSSTYQAIRNSDPYAAYGVLVDKVECNNHLFRNLCKKMRNASTMRLKAAPQKNVITVTSLRKQVHDCGLKIRRNIERARDVRKESSLPEAEKIKLFQKDILILLPHVFGQHVSCQSLPFLCEPKENEKNLILELERTGMYRDVAEAIRYLSCHAKSLLKCQTNNTAEACNSIVNKLNSGKRINHCARNSYQMRCYGAVVQHNSQKLLSRLYHRVGRAVPQHIAKLECRRQQHVLQNKLLRQQKGRRKFHTWQGTDKHYGPSSQQPDVPETVYEVLVDNHFDKLIENQENRIQIERDTINQSNCELWHQLRTSLITASKFGAICRMLETTSCSKMVQSIRFPKMVDTAATQFGTANEQAARNALELKLNKTIAPCGLFIDAEIPYLGASPDGLIDDDGIVEIKCPFSAKNRALDRAIVQIASLRSIFDRNNVDRLSTNHPYYYQIQGQLHITMRKFCIFALWTSVDLKHVIVPKDDAFWYRMEPLLSRFYMECLLPEIVDSRHNRNMPLREPNYILQAREDAQVKKQLVSRKKRAPKISQSRSKIRKTSDTFSSMNDVLLQTQTQHSEVAHKDRQFAMDWVSVQSDHEIDITEADIEALEVLRQNIDVDVVITNIMTKSALLTDTSIDLFQQIVQENTCFQFHPASYTGYYNFIRPCQSSRDMQIIGGNNSRHWCCIFYDGSQVMVYDSLCPSEYNIIHKEIRRYIHRRYPSIMIDDIIIRPVTKQPDAFSCGIYAAAFATTIALGDDPAGYEYCTNASTMRVHMGTIIRSRRLLPFPSQSS